MLDGVELGEDEVEKVDGAVVQFHCECHVDFLAKIYFFSLELRDLASESAKENCFFLKNSKNQF